MDNPISLLSHFQNLGFSDRPRMVLGCITLEHHPPEWTPLSHFWPFFKIYLFRMVRGRLWDGSKSDPISNPPSEWTPLSHFWPFFKIYLFRMVRGRLWDGSKSDPISNPPSEWTPLSHFWPFFKFLLFRIGLGWFLAALL